MKDEKRPLFRAAAFVAVQNEAGDYLFQKRQNTNYLDGFYDLASGHLEYGESVEDCAIRELREECGLICTKDDLELVVLFQSEIQPEVAYNSFVYRVKNYKGKPVVGEPDKISELSWFNIKNLPHKLTLGARIFVKNVDYGGRTRSYFVGPGEFADLMGIDYKDTINKVF